MVKPVDAVVDDLLFGTDRRKEDQPRDQDLRVHKESVYDFGGKRHFVYPGEVEREKVRRLANEALTRNAEAARQRLARATEIAEVTAELFRPDRLEYIAQRATDVIRTFAQKLREDQGLVQTFGDLAAAFALLRGRPGAPVRPGKPPIDTTPPDRRGEYDRSDFMTSRPGEVQKPGPGRDAVEEWRTGLSAKAAARIAVKDGIDGQETRPGTQVPKAPTLTVYDVNGQPVSNVTVKFEVTRGGGLIVDPADQVTDGRGEATVRWRLGAKPGINVLVATVKDQDISVDIMATAKN